MVKNVHLLKRVYLSLWGRYWLSSEAIVSLVKEVSLWLSTGNASDKTSASLVNKVFVGEKSVPKERDRFPLMKSDALV
jgi:hypothetical protein